MERRRASDRGVTLVEYALVVSLVLVGSTASFELMDEKIEDHYEETASDVGQVDLNEFDVATTGVPTTASSSSSSTAAPTSTAAAPTSSTAAPTSSTTAATYPTTPPTASLSMSAGDANTNGDFAESGGGYGAANGEGSNWNGADDTNDWIEFTFTVSSAGYYKIQGTVMAPNGNDDSFYVLVDGEPDPNGYLWDVERHTSYGTDYIGDRNGDDPVEVWLDAGEHTVTLYKREDGTYVSGLELVPA
jgi:hypothetical protein